MDVKSRGTWRKTMMVFCIILSTALVGAATCAPPAQPSTPVDLCARVAKNAGFSGEHLVISVAIAMGESGCNPNAINTANSNGTVDRGLWQINSVHGHPASSLFDPQYNANVAYSLYRNRGNRFVDWVVYNTGRYLDFMATARAAVNRLNTPPPPPPPPPPPHATGLASVSANRDFNGDGRDDIFWHGPGAVHDAVWRGQPGISGAFTSISETVSGSYAPVSGDFNNDGIGDVLWISHGSATDSLWFGRSGGGWTKHYPVSATSGARLNAASIYFPMAGDFNGDGFDDVFFYGPGSAPDLLWIGTSGQGRFYVQNVNVAGNYAPMAGDFNGDGVDDIFWHGPGAIADSIWWGTKKAGLASFTSQPQTVSGSYKPVAGDFNGDGRDDIYWYAIGSAQDSLWLGRADRTFNKTSPMNAAGTATVNRNGWHIPIVGDWNGDGRDDIFFYGPDVLTDTVWYAVGGQRFQSAPTNVTGSYTPA